MQCTKSEQEEAGKQESEKESQENKVTGIVTNADADAAEEGEEDAAEEDIPNTFSNNWKLNFVLAVVCCWFTMALTSWGSIEDKEGGCSKSSSWKGHHVGHHCFSVVSLSSLSVDTFST